MIDFLTGDLLSSNAEALVNTVNTVGIMGKGIALQFKEAFPYNNKEYIKACKNKELEPGKLFWVWDTNLFYGKKMIINFPTKTHWRQPSKYEYIREGLEALRELIIKENLTSIAIPPLGAGNGGLEWTQVKPMIIETLKGLPTAIQIYEPNATIKAMLQRQSIKKEMALTPARASLLYCLFVFESFGEYSSLFAANKLAYFLQRMGQELKLDFKKGLYGPYALGVEKVLYNMNGIFLYGLEQAQAKPFESLKLNYEKWDLVNDYVQGMADEDKNRLKKTLGFIKNFNSELSLEILATVDFILTAHPDNTLEEVMMAIANWNIRKKALFKKESVERAYHHLCKHKVQLSLV